MVSTNGSPKERPPPGGLRPLPLEGAALVAWQSRIHGAHDQDKRKNAVPRTKMIAPDHDTGDPAPPVPRRRPPGGRA